MSASKCKNKGGCKESTRVHIETYVQFENGVKHPCLLENYLLDSTVGEAKGGILKLAIMSDVTEKPNNITMCLAMPHVPPGPAMGDKELDDAAWMKDYIDDINCCSMIKLKKRNTEQH